jgi:hypothetical protein
LSAASSVAVIDDALHVLADQIHNAAHRGNGAGPGCAEQVQILRNEARLVVENITAELRFGATLLSDPGVSRRQLIARQRNAS